MGQQGDTVDTLLKLFDEEAIAETSANDDGHCFYDRRIEIILRLIT